MNILMITKSRYRDDVRVRREAETLAGHGHSVQVMALDTESARFDGVEVMGLGEPTGLRAEASSREVPRLVRWALLPEHRARAVEQFRRSVLDQPIETRPDVVHAHDLPALAPAAEIADKYGSRLVYDTHEVWAGMARHGRPDPLRRLRDLREERELARRADLVITVSEGAARLLTKSLQLSALLVVRNTFPARSDLEAPSRPAGAVYAGRIGPDRDLATVVNSTLWEQTSLRLHLMGPLSDGLDLPDGVILHPSGSMDDVDRLLSAQGIALVPLSSGPPNHDVALPNKLFQAVAVGIPVVAAALHEMSRLVGETGIGALYESGDVESFDRAVGSLVEDYDRYLTAVRDSRSALDWSVDAKRLVDAYQSL